MKNYLFEIKMQQKKEKVIEIEVERIFLDGNYLTVSRMRTFEAFLYILLNLSIRKDIPK